MLDGEHPSCHSWVCGECCCVIKNELSLSSLLHEKGSSNDSILQCRNDVVKEMISVLSNDGILLNTKYKQIYKAKILNLGISVETADKLVVNFCKFVDRLLTTKYDFKSFSKPPKPGVVYYNSFLVNSASISYIFDLIVDNYNSVSCNKLNIWLKEQVFIFPQNYTRFHYCKLINNNEFDDLVFSKYYHQEMENFF